MKGKINEFKNSFLGTKDTLLLFIKSNKAALVIMISVILLGYGSKVFLYTNQFDTIIMQERYLANLKWWAGIGRFSLVIMKLIFENGFLNSTYSNFLAIIAWAAAISIWGAFLFSKMDNLGKKIESITFVIFCVLFATTPIMAEQFSFTLQNWEVMTGFSIVVAGIWCFLKYVESNNYLFLFGAGILTAWCIGLYQSFISIFVLGALAKLLLEACINMNQRVTWRYVFTLIIKFIQSMILSLIFYFISNRIVIRIMSAQPEAYLSGNFKWFEQGVYQSIIEILKYIKSLIWSNENYYSSYVYGFIFLAFLLFAFAYSNKIYNFLLRLAIIGSPFYFSVLFGGAVMYRIQIVLPLTVAICGAVLIYDMGKFCKRRILTVLGTAVLIIFGCRNSQILNQAFYTEYMQYNYDVNICYDINNKIEKYAGNGLKKVAFIGRRNKKSILQTGMFYENIGSSLFQIDWAGDLNRSERIVYLMNTLGLDYQPPSGEEFWRAYEYCLSSNLESYPKEDCVGILDDIIVVKLDVN